MLDILPDAFATAREATGASSDFAMTGTTFEYAMGFDPWGSRLKQPLPLASRPALPRDLPDFAGPAL